MKDVLLVHGAWHGGWCFAEVIGELEDRGLTCHTVDLPSSGSTATLSDDAAVVREKIADIDAPVLAVGHSYGGIVISESAADATGLLYLCAFQLDAAESLVGALSAGMPPWIAVDDAAGTMTVTDPDHAFYHDCTPEQQAAAAAKLAPQSIASFAAEQTAAAWRDLPSTYVICEQDHAIPPAAQEAMSARSGTVHRMDASHSPFLSMPGPLADLIAAAAD
ncbi:MAG: hypothetical protein QOF76_1699 [Solirubrobacteraceae bacterium]|jgi:pimeloyl-ACP methyl ester carboxylesterase|nr:hypothetical protein [Solirubrobacteraceae bacterium]